MPDTPVEALIHLVQDTEEKLKFSNKHHAHDGESLSDALARFSSARLIPLLTQEKNSMQSPYILALVGLTNVGKSTLTEALLGFPVAPQKSGPATAIPVEYVYGNNWEMEILFRNFHTEVIPFIDAKALGAELTKRVVDINSKMVSTVAWVTVKGPMKMLKSGLTLADTPGFGATQIGDDDGAHQKRLEEFICDRVHRVYFCVAAGEEWTISDIEKDFYKRLSHICSHVIVNKWTGTSTEAEEYEHKYSSIFPFAKFIFVNALKAIKGQNENSSELFELSNLQAFHDIIEAYSTPGKRVNMCIPEIIRAWDNFHIYLKRKFNCRHIPWAEVSKQNFINSCSGNAVFDKITKNILGA